MNLLVHHVSPVPTNMTESLYDEVKREWVHHFQSLSLEVNVRLNWLQWPQNPCQVLYSFPWDGLFTREVQVYGFRKTSGST